ncbi:MAG: hypothetical protein LBR73_00400 [Oscillospiraceae bacterium]|jgi:hypothetical protein|nr:hypothetical protein [Oscillospiraceae bacterium]
MEKHTKRPFSLRALSVLLAFAMLVGLIPAGMVMNSSAAPDLTSNYIELANAIRAMDITAIEFTTNVNSMGTSWPANTYDQAIRANIGDYGSAVYSRGYFNGSGRTDGAGANVWNAFDKFITVAMTLFFNDQILWPSSINIGGGSSAFYPIGYQLTTKGTALGQYNFTSSTAKDPKHNTITRIAATIKQGLEEQAAQPGGVTLTDAELAVVNYFISGATAGASVSTGTGNPASAYTSGGAPGDYDSVHFHNTTSTSVSGSAAILETPTIMKWLKEVDNNITVDHHEEGYLGGFHPYAGTFAVTRTALDALMSGTQDINQVNSRVDLVLEMDWSHKIVNSNELQGWSMEEASGADPCGTGIFGMYEVRDVYRAVAHQLTGVSKLTGESAAYSNLTAGNRTEDITATINALKLYMNGGDANGTTYPGHKAVGSNGVGTVSVNNYPFTTLAEYKKWEAALNYVAGDYTAINGSASNANVYAATGSILNFASRETVNKVLAWYGMLPLESDADQVQYSLTNTNPPITSARDLQMELARKAELLQSQIISDWRYFLDDEDTNDGSGLTGGNVSGQLQKTANQIFFSNANAPEDATGILKAEFNPNNPFDDKSTTAFDESQYYNFQYGTSAKGLASLQAYYNELNTRLSGLVSRVPYDTATPSNGVREDIENWNGAWKYVRVDNDGVFNFPSVVGSSSSPTYYTKLTVGLTGTTANGDQEIALAYIRTHIAYVKRVIDLWRAHDAADALLRVASVPTIMEHLGANDNVNAAPQFYVTQNNGTTSYVYPYVSTPTGYSSNADWTNYTSDVPISSSIVLDGSPTTSVVYALGADATGVSAEYGNGNYGSRPSTNAYGYGGQASTERTSSAVYAFTHVSEAYTAYESWSQVTQYDATGSLVSEAGNMTYGVGTGGGGYVPYTDRDSIDATDWVTTSVGTTDPTAVRAVTTYLGTQLYTAWENGTSSMPASYGVDPSTVTTTWVDHYKTEPINTANDSYPVQESGQLTTEDLMLLISTLQSANSAFSGLTQSERDTIIGDTITYNSMQALLTRLNTEKTYRTDAEVKWQAYRDYFFGILDADYSNVTSPSTLVSMYNDFRTKLTEYRALALSYVSKLNQTSPTLGTGKTYWDEIFGEFETDVAQPAYMKIMGLIFNAYVDRLVGSDSSAQAYISDFEDDVITAGADVGKSIDTNNGVDRPIQEPSWTDISKKYDGDAYNGGWVYTPTGYYEIIPDWASFGNLSKGISEKNSSLLQPLLQEGKDPLFGTATGDPTKIPWELFGVYGNTNYTDDDSNAGKTPLTISDARYYYMYIVERAEPLYVNFMQNPQVYYQQKDQPPYPRAWMEDDILDEANDAWNNTLTIDDDNNDPVSPGDGTAQASTNSEQYRYPGTDPDGVNPPNMGDGEPMTDTDQVLTQLITKIDVLIGRDGNLYPLIQSMGGVDSFLSMIGMQSGGSLDLKKLLTPATLAGEQVVNIATVLDQALAGMLYSDSLINMIISAAYPMIAEQFENELNIDINDMIGNMPGLDAGLYSLHNILDPDATGHNPFDTKTGFRGDTGISWGSGGDKPWNLMDNPASAVALYPDLLAKKIDRDTFPEVYAKLGNYMAWTSFMYTDFEWGNYNKLHAKGGNGFTLKAGGVSRVDAVWGSEYFCDNDLNGTIDSGEAFYLPWGIDDVIDPIEKRDRFYAAMGSAFSGLMPALNTILFGEDSGWLGNDWVGTINISLGDLLGSLLGTNIFDNFTAWMAGLTASIIFAGVPLTIWGLGFDYSGKSQAILTMRLKFDTDDRSIAAYQGILTPIFEALLGKDVESIPSMATAATGEFSSKGIRLTAFRVDGGDVAEYLTAGGSPTQGTPDQSREFAGKDAAFRANATNLADNPATPLYDGGAWGYNGGTAAVKAIFGPIEAFLSKLKEAPVTEIINLIPNLVTALNANRILPLLSKVDLNVDVEAGLNTNDDAKQDGSITNLSVSINKITDLLDDLNILDVSDLLGDIGSGLKGEDPLLHKGKPHIVQGILGDLTAPNGTLGFLNGGIEGILRSELLGMGDLADSLPMDLLNDITTSGVMLTNRATGLAYIDTRRPYTADRIYIDADKPDVLKSLLDFVAGMIAPKNGEDKNYEVTVITKLLDNLSAENLVPVLAELTEPKKYKEQPVDYPAALPTVHTYYPSWWHDDSEGARQDAIYLSENLDPLINNLWLSIFGYTPNVGGTLGWYPDVDTSSTYENGTAIGDTSVNAWLNWFLTEKLLAGDTYVDLLIMLRNMLLDLTKDFDPNEPSTMQTIFALVKELVLIGGKGIDVVDIISQLIVAINQQIGAHYHGDYIVDTESPIAAPTPVPSPIGLAQWSRPDPDAPATDYVNFADISALIAAACKLLAPAGPILQFLMGGSNLSLIPLKTNKSTVGPTGTATTIDPYKLHKGPEANYGSLFGIYSYEGYNNGLLPIYNALLAPLLTASDPTADTALASTAFSVTNPTADDYAKMWEAVLNPLLGPTSLRTMLIREDSTAIFSTLLQLIPELAFFVSTPLASGGSTPNDPNDDVYEGDSPLQDALDALLEPLYVLIDTIRPLLYDKAGTKVIGLNDILTEFVPSMANDPLGPDPDTLKLLGGAITISLEEGVKINVEQIIDEQVNPMLQNALNSQILGAYIVPEINLRELILGKYITTTKPADGQLGATNSATTCDYHYYVKADKADVLMQLLHQIGLTKWLDETGMGGLTYLITNGPIDMFPINYEQAPDVINPIDRTRYDSSSDPAASILNPVSYPSWIQHYDLQYITDNADTIIDWIWGAIFNQEDRGMNALRLGVEGFVNDLLTDAVPQLGLTFEMKGTMEETISAMLGATLYKADNLAYIATIVNGLLASNIIEDDPNTAADESRTIATLTFGDLKTLIGLDLAELFGENAAKMLDKRRILELASAILGFQYDTDGDGTFETMERLDVDKLIRQFGFYVTKPTSSDNGTVYIPKNGVSDGGTTYQATDTGYTDDQGNAIIMPTGYYKEFVITKVNAQEDFLNATADLIGPIMPILDFLFNGANLLVFPQENWYYDVVVKDLAKDPTYSENNQIYDEEDNILKVFESMARTCNGFLTVHGGEGYINGLMPIYMALLNKNASKYVVTPADYKADPANRFKAILQPLLGIIDEIITSPVSFILDLVPNLAYFVSDVKDRNFTEEDLQPPVPVDEPDATDATKYPGGTSDAQYLTDLAAYNKYLQDQAAYDAKIGNPFLVENDPDSQYQTQKDWYKKSLLEQAGANLLAPVLVMIKEMPFIGNLLTDMVGGDGAAIVDSIINGHFAVGNLLDAALAALKDGGSITIFGSDISLPGGTLKYALTIQDLIIGTEKVFDEDYKLADLKWKPTYVDVDQALVLSQLLKAFGAYDMIEANGLQGLVYFLHNFSDKIPENKIDYQYSATADDDAVSPYEDYVNAPHYPAWFTEKDHEYVTDNIDVLIDWVWKKVALDPAAKGLLEQIAGDYIDVLPTLEDTVSSAWAKDGVNVMLLNTVVKLMNETALPLLNSVAAYLITGSNTRPDGLDITDLVGDFIWVNEHKIDLNNVISQFTSLYTADHYIITPGNDGPDGVAGTADDVADTYEYDPTKPFVTDKNGNGTAEDEALDMLTELLASIMPILDFLLSNAELRLLPEPPADDPATSDIEADFTNPNDDNDDIDTDPSADTGEPREFLRIWGSNGYESALLPILLMLVNDDANRFTSGYPECGILSVAEFTRQIESKPANVSEAAYAARYLELNKLKASGILNPIIYFINKLAADPVDTLLELIPNVAYFLTADPAIAAAQGLDQKDASLAKQAVYNLLAPVWPLFEAIKDTSNNAIVDLYNTVVDLDLETMINDIIAGLGLFPSSVTLASFIIGRVEEFDPYYDCAKRNEEYYINTDIPALVNFLLSEDCLNIYSQIPDGLQGITYLLHNWEDETDDSHQGHNGDIVPLTIDYRAYYPTSDGGNTDLATGKQWPDWGAANIANFSTYLTDNLDTVLDWLWLKAYEDPKGQELLTNLLGDFVTIKPTLEKTLATVYDKPVRNLLENTLLPLVNQQIVPVLQTSGFDVSSGHLLIDLSSLGMGTIADITLPADFQYTGGASDTFLTLSEVLKLIVYIGDQPLDLDEVIAPFQAYWDSTNNVADLSSVLDANGELDEEGALTILADLISGAMPLFDFLFMNDDIRLFPSDVDEAPEVTFRKPNPTATQGAQGTAGDTMDRPGEAIDEFLRIHGNNGYAYGFLPIYLMLVNMGYEDAGILTPDEYRAAEKPAKVRAIVDPLIYLVNTIAADPIQTILELLPNVVYFIDDANPKAGDQSLLQQAVYNLLYPVRVLVDGIGAADPEGAGLGAFLGSGAEIEAARTLPEIVAALLGTNPLTGEGTLDIDNLGIGDFVNDLLADLIPGIKIGDTAIFGDFGGSLQLKDLIVDSIARFNRTDNSGSSRTLEQQVGYGGVANYVNVNPAKLLAHILDCLEVDEFLNGNMGGVAGILDGLDLRGLINLINGWEPPAPLKIDYGQAPEPDPAPEYNHDILKPEMTQYLYDNIDLIIEFIWSRIFAENDKVADFEAALGLDSLFPNGLIEDTLEDTLLNAVGTVAYTKSNLELIQNIFKDTVIPMVHGLKVKITQKDDQGNITYQEWVTLEEVVQNVIYIGDDYDGDGEISASEYAPLNLNKILESIDTYQIQDPAGDPAAFEEELINLLHPLAPVLDFLFTGYNLYILPEATVNLPIDDRTSDAEDEDKVDFISNEFADDVTPEPLSFLRFYGNEGYERGLLPLLMALVGGIQGDEFVDVNGDNIYDQFPLVTPADFNANPGTEDHNRKVIEAIANPILCLLTNICENPLQTILNLLPNLAYFISDAAASGNSQNEKSLLQQAVDRILTPVTHILDVVATLGDADDVIMSLTGGISLDLMGVSRTIEINDLRIGDLLNEILQAVLGDGDPTTADDVLQLEDLIIGQLGNWEPAGLWEVGRDTREERYEDAYVDYPGSGGLADAAYYVDVNIPEILANLLDELGVLSILDGDLKYVLGILLPENYVELECKYVYYPTVNTQEPVDLYPYNFWTEKQAEYVALNADRFFNQLCILLFGKPLGSVPIVPGEPVSPGILSELVGSFLYDGTLYNTITNALKPVLENVLDILDMSLLDEVLGDADFALNRIVNDILAGAVTVGNEELDVKAILEEILQIIEDGPATEIHDSTSFREALSALLAPVVPLLSFLLAGRDLEIIPFDQVNRPLAENGTADNTRYDNTAHFVNYQEDGTVVEQDAFIYATGFDGYRYGLIPILEMLTMPFNDGDLVVGWEEFDAMATAGDSQGMLDAILNPIFGLVERLCNRPFDTLLTLLPNIVYFADNRGVNTNPIDPADYSSSPLQQSIRRLLYPLWFTAGRAGLGDMLNIDIDGIVHGLLNDTSLGYTALRRIAIGTLRHEESASGGGDTYGTDYDVHYLTVTVDDRADVITAFMRLILDLLGTKSMRDGLLDAIIEFGAPADIINTVRNLIGWILDLMLWSDWARDQIIANIYWSWMQGSSAVDAIYDSWYQGNLARQQIYDDLNGGDAEDNEDLQAVDQLWDDENTNGDDTSPSSGVAPNGWVRFWMSVWEWLGRVWDFLFGWIG